MISKKILDAKNKNLKKRKSSMKYKDGDVLSATHLYIISIMLKHKYFNFTPIANNSKSRLGISRSKFLQYLSLLGKKGIIEKIDFYSNRHKYKLLMTAEEIESKFGIFIPTSPTDKNIEIKEI